ncbi:MAG: hypothetical protein J5691_05730 [Bacilli bacterium]|nr:hypothetical protein [Bacilli bacterium]
MIKTINDLKKEYKAYVNIYDKIRREAKAGKLISVKRGIYETNKSANKIALANAIVYPSYISFESALSFYDMIPERVYLTMSATFRKNKTKEFVNDFGDFYYEDINEGAYPYGVDIIQLEGYSIMIASREKALLDTLSKIKINKSEETIEELLFEDLRIDEIEFDKLDKEKLIDLSYYYKSKTIKMLREHIESKNK